MFRSLLAKEWRQLRLLRWSGIGLGLLLPFLLLALAGASDRGWISGSPTHSTPPVVLGEALPLVLAFGLWPLLALMIAAHALASDRAAGTDAFLLERPVSRSRVWLARVLVAVSTTLVIVAAHVAIWWGLSRLVGGPASAVGRAEWLGMMLLAGGVAVGVALTAGVAAGALARTPIQALLLGLVLAAVPVAIGALLCGRVFYGYRIEGLPVGAALPVLLPAGYVLASWVAECRGEPAGRGRTRRGVLVLVVALSAVPLVFAATVPVVLRWDARSGIGNTRFVPAPSGDVTLALNDWQRAAWLIDTATGRKLRFFPPPVYAAAWSPEGSRLAVLHGAGATGRFLSDPRLEILGPDGGPRRPAIDCRACRGWWDDGLFWAGDRVVTPGFVNGRESVLIFDPATGDRQVVEIPPPVLRWHLLGAPEAPAGHGLYVLQLRSPRSRDRVTDSDGTAPGALLRRLDVADASLGTALDLPEPGAGRFGAFRSRLSPSGRSWFRPGSLDGGTPAAVYDLETGASLTLDAREAVWLSGDRLAWTRPVGEGRFDLVVGSPGEGRSVRTFEGKWLWLKASPDRRRLLVTGAPGRQVWTCVVGPAGRVVEQVSLDDEWSDTWYNALQWAGPDRLGLIRQGALALLEPRADAEPEYVIGGPAH
jgi:ABC-type transport system involved in multi-copper enzyme maturation permease subunit